jgi:hypothetical protein
LTLLHLISEGKGRLSATSLLLRHVAKVHVRNNKGETPFQLAQAKDYV